MDGKEILFILQKFSLEIIILAFLICAIVYLVNKYAPEGVKKYSIYYPYALGIVFYGLYALVFSLKLEVNEIINLGITTGGISTILLSFVKSQKNKRSMAENLLSGIISERDLKIVRQKIDEAENEEKIAEILSDYSIFPISAKQAEIFAEIIAFSKKEGV